MAESEQLSVAQSILVLGWLFGTMTLTGASAAAGKEWLAFLFFFLFMLFPLVLAVGEIVQSWIYKKP